MSFPFRLCSHPSDVNKLNELPHYYSTVQSPSWAANRFAASQEIPHISWNPKVHYHTHERPPPVSILGQPNPVHIPTSQLLEIQPNIIHPSMPRSPHWSLSREEFVRDLVPVTGPAMFLIIFAWGRGDQYKCAQRTLQQHGYICG